MIPAKHLLNGTTVRQVKRRRITYHHIKLAVHDVVLAEGLPAETHLATGDRAKFASGTVIAPHPDVSPFARKAMGCAPMAVTGPRLDQIRQDVNARAA